MQDDVRTWGEKPGYPGTDIENMECQMMIVTGGSGAHGKNPKKNSYRGLDPSVRVED